MSPRAWPLRVAARPNTTRRMHAVIEHIDRHLDQKLDLATLAGVAHFSPFHFHRLFRALMGEALGDYLRRRRLEIAAVRLRVAARVPGAAVSRSAWASVPREAFTRAFRARFGCSPTEWRNSKRDQMARKARSGSARSLDGKTGGSSNKETAMKVKLIDREPVHVAYLRHTGSLRPGDRASSGWTTVAPWMATNNLMGRERFGISLDDPTVTKPARCRYDACVASPEGEVLSGNPQRKVIPGGKYAALAFEGTGRGDRRGVGALLRDWLPKSGLQLDSRPFFEHYPVDGRYDPKTGAFSCDICVPVALL